ncbi:MAG: hypothetical protein ABID83_04670 [Candidatus Omnitrophota bacterium]
MKKRILPVVVLVILTAFFAAPNLHAQMKQMPMMKKHTEESLEEQFYGKVSSVLKNHEELGLSEEQIEAIKALKVKVKKYLIKQNAEIDVLTVEINTQTWEDTMNMGALNELVARQYGLKEEQQKYLAAAIAELKKILSQEQAKKVKSLKMKQM